MRCNHDSLVTYTRIYKEDKIGVSIMCQKCSASFIHMYEGEEAKDRIKKLKDNLSAIAKREVHFYTNQKYIPPNTSYFVGWEEAEQALRIRDSVDIHTTQMGLLEFAWADHFKYGDRVFVHDEFGFFEVMQPCTRTNRELREGHNIYRMWIAGEFDPPKEK